jgi:predicted AlkP superfamily phosphohydrolase/phosphomutase
MTNPKNGTEKISPRQGSKKKLLVIGIDGGTLDIVLPMVHAGKLPNLSRLIHNGTYATLQSTIPPVTAPAWSSFITGTNPGQHGVFYFFKTEKDHLGGGNRKILANLNHIRGIPFWKVLNKHGKKVGLLNIPLTYPPQKVNGFMVSGMLVPKDSKDYTFPPELFSKLDKYYVDIDGLMVAHKWHAEELVDKDRVMFKQNVFQLSKSRAHNALKLMKREPWDLFMVVFTGSDRICHFFWEDPDREVAFSSAVQEYYILLDALIGDLVRAAGENTVKIVMSDHGFGPAPKKKINIFALAKILGADMQSLTFRYRYLKNRILSKIGRARRETLIDLLIQENLKISLMPLYANFLGIHINHKNCASIKSQLIHQLKTLRHPHADAKMVERILPKDSLFRGPFAGKAPDLVAQFSYNYQLVFERRSNRLVSDIPKRVKTGEHRMEGLFIASGPQIEPGKLEGEFAIQDVTPTLLYLMGTPIPENYDGRLITELFSNDYLNVNTPRYQVMGDKLELSPDQSTTAEQDDFEKSKELLEGLGYL